MKLFIPESYRAFQKENKEVSASSQLLPSAKHRAGARYEAGNRIQLLPSGKSQSRRG